LKGSKDRRAKMSTDERFEIMKVLGEGASCKVVSAKDRATSQLYAMKIMDKSEPYNKVLWENETLILRTLRHANILEFVDSYEDKKTFHLLTVLCQGGELFDRVKNGSFSEKVAARLTKEMLQALEYCHAHNVVHRDLKPENFVFDTLSEDSNMKLIDFGCAKIAGDDDIISDVAGSPYYCLASDTLVAKADGTHVKAKDVKRGMRLVGEDHQRPVQVSDVKVFTDAGGVYTVTTRNGSYKVTARHMLTLRVCQNPFIRIRKKSGQKSGMAHVTLEYRCATHGKHRCGPDDHLHPSLHTITRSFTVQLREGADTDDSPAAAAATVAIDDEELIELDLSAESMAQDEAEAEAGSDHDASDIHMDPTPHATSSLDNSSSTLVGTYTRDEIQQWMIAELKKRRALPRSRYVRRGDLIEMPVQELHERSVELQLFTDSPVLSGRVVPIPIPIPHVQQRRASAEPIQTQTQCTKMMMMVGEDEYEDVWLDMNDLDAKIVYQLHNPPSSPSSSTSPSESESEFNTFRQLERLHQSMAINIDRNAGVIVSELHSDTVSGMVPSPDDYVEACQRNVEEMLKLNASTIVAFGALTRDSWLGSVQSLKDRALISEWVEEEVGGLRSLLLTRTSMDGRTTATATRVFFAPHPCQWRLMRWLVRALALAHGRPLSDADEVVAGASSPERLDLCNIEPPPQVDGLPLPAEVVNIAIEGKREEEKRYALADGSLTHNCAPEVLADENYVRTGKVWKAADMWSLGCIVFILVCGYPPFNGDSQERIFKKIRRGKFRFPKSSENGGVTLSDSVKSLITDLLQMQPSDRLTASDALKHPWIAGDAAPDAPLPSAVVEALGAFRSKMRLKKAVARVLAHHMTEDDRENLAAVFKKFDQNGDGQLGADEIAEMMRHIGAADGDQEAKKLMDEMDEDGDGGVSMDEFATHVTMGQLGKNKAQIKATFDMFDLDHDGFITHNEIEKVCGFLTPEATLNLIKEVDANNDGKVSFNEWLDAMSDMDLKATAAAAAASGNGNNVNSTSAKRNRTSAQSNIAAPTPTTAPAPTTPATSAQQ